LVFYISFLIRFFFLKSVSELDFEFYAIWICERDLAVFVSRESFLGANLFDRIFRGVDLIFYLGISVPLISSPIFLKFAGSG
jgi:hypothetical protein